MKAGLWDYVGLIAVAILWGANFGVSRFAIAEFIVLLTKAMKIKLRNESTGGSTNT